MGVPCGAVRPTQNRTSYPGRPASATVGMSGNVRSRFGPVTASPISRPCRTSSCTGAMLENMIFI